MEEAREAHALPNIMPGRVSLLKNWRGVILSFCMKY